MHECQATCQAACSTEFTCSYDNTAQLCGAVTMTLNYLMLVAVDCAGGPVNVSSHPPASAELYFYIYMSSNEVQSMNESPTSLAKVLRASTV